MLSNIVRTSQGIIKAMIRGIRSSQFIVGKATSKKGKFENIRVH